MASFYNKFGKCLLTAITASSGGALFYYGAYSENNKTAFAHWRTQPSTKWEINWDRREPVDIVKVRLGSAVDQESDVYKEQLDKVSPKATRHLFLIRHGQYDLNGTSDKERVLTDLGKAQAHYTGIRLKEFNFPYTDVIKSTMTRAQQTANIIETVLKDKYKNIKVNSCSLLEEGAPIPPEPPVTHWTPDSTEYYEDGPRIEAAFRKHIHRAEPHQTKDSYEIIVCHGNVIRYFVCRALQFPPEAWLRFTLHHCSITWITITPSGRVVVRSVGDCGHLPPEAVTPS